MRMGLTEPVSGTRIWVCALANLLSLLVVGLTAEITGTFKPWHTLTLIFDNGPLSASKAEINPFLEYRLDVTFEFFGSAERNIVLKRSVVPGYFAGDGRGGQKGRVWACKFTSAHVGRWEWRASFRRGSLASVEESSGAPLAFDGQEGKFVIEEQDESSSQLLRRGKLQYVGGRYFRWDGSGEYYIKVGTNTPENALGYQGFNGLENSTHDWKAHVKDWSPGDPDWGEGKGKGIIGMVNYLASKGVNSFFAILITVKGDSKGDVHPWLGQQAAQRTRYDVARLDQWYVVFEHCVKQGLALNLAFLETENEALFEHDEGLSLTEGFAPSRKLFYREMVARFGSLLGLTWTIGEENGWSEPKDRGGGFPWGSANSDEQRRRFTNYIRDLDLYQTPIQVHTLPELKEKIYGPLLGLKNGKAIEGASLQTGVKTFVYSQVLEWVTKSHAAGKPWVVTSDEIGDSIPLDSEGGPNSSFRSDFVWGNVMAMGAGVEIYNGAVDVTLNDFRELERSFTEFTRIVKLMDQAALPFWALEVDSSLYSGANAKRMRALSKHNFVYLVYQGQQGADLRVDLRAASGNFEVGWFRPARAGGPLFKENTRVQGGQVTQLSPPRSTDSDWALIVARSIPCFSKKILDLSADANALYQYLQ